MKKEAFYRLLVGSEDLLSNLSGSDGALQRSLVLGQVGVGLRHPGQGGAVRVEMRPLTRRVEEPTLRDHNPIIH